MPHDSKQKLPDSVRDNLPAHAQDIYKDAFNSAREEYADPSKRQDDVSREEVSHRVAWAAVKKSYRKGEDEKWHKS